MYAFLLRLERLAVRLEEIVIFVAFSGLVINLFLQVLFRFVLKVPLDFTEEVSRVLLIWLVFVGAARGAHASQHFVVGLAFDAMPPTARRLVGRLVDFITILFLATLGWYSWQAAQMGAVQTLPVLGTSVIVQTLAMPVGMGLMALHAIMLLIRHRCEGEAAMQANLAEEAHS